jgi:hypothetical protein
VWLIAGGLIAAMLLILVLRSPPIRDANTDVATPPEFAITGAPGQSMTLDPQIIDNLTNCPKATPLAGQTANDITGLRQMVDTCADYDAQRRIQMDQQIEFLMNPASLPAELLIALGTNPHGRLLYALANLTKIQWQLANSPASSCLVPIGKRLNQLLVADGQAPIAAFEGG